jgi:hypothetical protein
MDLTLDFGDARETACHCYTGVMARIDTADWSQVTITPEGCHHGLMDVPGTVCHSPVVDGVQAWSVAMLLTGTEAASPVGEALWDPTSKRMVFPLRSSGRRPITDFINALPTS